MKKFAIAVLLAAFIATPALADNTGTFYIATDLGVAKCCNLPNYSGWPGWSTPSVLRIAGGYHFSPVFALEMGYSTGSVIPMAQPVRLMDWLQPPFPSLHSRLQPSPACRSVSSSTCSASLGLPATPSNIGTQVEDMATIRKATCWSVFGAEFHVNPQVGLRADIR